MEKNIENVVLEHWRWILSYSVQVGNRQLKTQTPMSKLKRMPEEFYRAYKAKLDQITELVKKLQVQSHEHPQS